VVENEVDSIDDFFNTARRTEDFRDKDEGAIYILMFL
jgi:hypothetical protein